MIIAETKRLRLRWMEVDDAPFILRLLNEPSWLAQIGDKGVRCEADAVAYIESGPRAMIREFGHGLYLVEQQASGEPIGICGLLRRDSLPDPDLGFALVPAHWKQGYAFEAAEATLRFGQKTLGLSRVLAITLPTNTASTRLLERLGFTCLGLQPPDADGTELLLFEKSL